MNKPINQIVTRQLPLQVVRAEGSEEHEFVISTEAVDSFETVFKIDGWDLASYNRNPIFCYQHRVGTDDPDNILGTSEVRVENGQLIAKPKYDDADFNPKADKIRKKVNAGTLRMASISARILDGRWGDKELGENPDILYFTRMELVEWSIVSVASNPEALKRSADALEQIKTAFTPSKENKVRSFKTNEARFKLNQNNS